MISSLRTLLVLLVFWALGSSFAASCWESVQTTTSLLEAVQNKKWTDTESSIVALTAQDLKLMRFQSPAPLRPEFEIVIFDSNGFALLALVPRKEMTLENQQVVQWQLTQIPVGDFGPEFLPPQLKKGRLHFKIKKQKWWQNQRTDFKSQILVTPKVVLEKVSYHNLKEYLIQNPLMQQPSGSQSWAQSLFGKAWIKIWSPKGKLNSLEASTEILEQTRIIVPGKNKFLHVKGEVFTSQMTITEQSPFTGDLKPGSYNIVGRLSASIKDFKIKSENGSLQTNSMAMSLLIFKTQSELETPGLLFLQDSLANIENPGLQDFSLTNNPNFGFKPKTVREFFEQGLTVFGVAFSSFKNSRDSGRGVQGNFRSTLGAASSGVELMKGDFVKGPKFIAIRFQSGSEKKDPSDYSSHAEFLKSDRSHGFELVFSEDGNHWRPFGKLHQFDWLNSDSHELTFPHTLSGTIDPQTLKAAGGLSGSPGLLLPSQVIKLP